MTDDQVKHIVARFLAWKLPEDFRPDGGISFERDYNVHTPWPMKHEPTGTNLLSAAQAEIMVRHMLEGAALESQTVSTSLPDLNEFRKFVNLIEGRAMACDGPVTPFLEELHAASDAEKERFTAILSAIYKTPAPKNNMEVKS